MIDVLLTTSVEISFLPSNLSVQVVSSSRHASIPKWCAFYVYLASEGASQFLCSGKANSFEEY
jgi:hypothetical protein